MQVPATESHAGNRDSGARHRFFRSYLGLILGFLPGLLAVDLWVGWLDRGEGSDEDYYIVDERLGWRPRPHFERPEFETKLDRFGMRSPEIPADAPQGEVRILGVGASGLYGAGSVHQPVIWNYHLQRSLDRLEPGAFRVLNGAVMAYSGAQSCRRAVQLLGAEEEAVRIAPDLVFVILSPGAQRLLDPRRTQNWVLVGGDLIGRDVLAGWPEFLWPLRTGLHRLAMKSNLYVRERAKFQLTEDGALDDKIQGWCLSRAPQPEALRELIELTLAEYETLHAACLAQGVEFRALIVPESYQDSEKRWASYLRTSQGRGAPPIGTHRLEGVELLETWLRERGLPSWNFTEEITRIGVDPPRFYSHDGRHWSGEGHEIVAQGIERRLREEGLLTRLRAARQASPGR